MVIFDPLHLLRHCKLYQKLRSQFHYVCERNVGESLGINWLILYIYCVQPAVRVHMRDEILRRMYICCNCGYLNKMLSKFGEISLVKYYIDRFSCSFRIATRLGSEGKVREWGKTWEKS